MTVRFPLLAAGGILLTGTVAAVAAVSIGRDSIRSAAFGATEAGADAYGRSVQVYLSGATDDLVAAAAQSEIGRAWGTPGRMAGPNDALDKRAVLRARLELSSTFEFLALARPDGRVYMVEPAAAQANLTRPDVAHFPWFRAIRDGGRAVVSDLHVSTVTHRPSVAVAVQVVNPAGDDLGYLYGGLRLSELSTLGGSPSGDYFGYLTDSRGLVVAHGRNPRYAVDQTDFSTVPAVRLALAGGTGAIENTNLIEGEERISGYRRLDGLGWAVVYVLPSRVAFGPATELTVAVALVTALLVAIFGIGGAVAARRAAQPIERLATAAAAVAAGDRSVRLPPVGGDEVGRLSREFGTMVEALDQRESELRQRAADLEAAHAELEAFAYSVAHDLRTPLRAISGFGAMLADRLAEHDGETLRELAVIRGNAGRMAELIDDLLAFARLGRQKPEIKDVDTRAIAKGSFRDLAMEIGGRDIHFRVAPDIPPCRADPRLLTQVFTNLISNAVKFTGRSPRPARIEVGCRRNGAQPPSYFVRDNGVGLDPAHGEEIFGVFTRLFRDDEYEGTGVGLAIVRRIVELHGGRTWVESKPDKGATFLFTLEEATP